MTLARRNPTLVLGLVATIGWLVNQAATGEVTWVAALPLIVAIVVRSLVTPAAPGWVAQHGALLGTVGSVAVIAGQLLDGTVTPALALPLVLGVFAQLLPDPTVNTTS